MSVCIVDHIIEHEILGIRAGNVGGAGGSYILENGTIPFTGNQSIGNNRLTELANGIDPNDAINLSQLNSAVTSASMVRWRLWLGA